MLSTNIQRSENNCKNQCMVDAIDINCIKDCINLISTATGLYQGSRDGF